MEQLTQQATVYLDKILIWLQATALSYETLGQFAVIVVLSLISSGIVFWVKPLLSTLLGSWKYYDRYQRHVEPLYIPFLWALFLLIAQEVALAQDQPIYLIRLAVSLVLAWIVIRLASGLIANAYLARLVRIMAWTVAALNIVGWLGPVVSFLDTTTFTIGEHSVSILGVFSGLFTAGILIWGGLFLAGVMENWLRKLPTVTPSARVLLSKVARILFVAIAFLFAISSMGIDLTALAVFGGAIGVGLGFGLQKVVSNFISGVILLLDQSIKPGDVVEVSGTYGRINKLASRYTSVVSRDGREHLVPNEDMITQPVVNWTHSNKQVRRHLPVGISYKSDVDKAIELMLLAADETDRVIRTPEPRVLIKGFGDNSIDLELRIWIMDSENGVSNVASDVYLAVWRQFNEGGIEFPYPQRDLHIVSAKGLQNPLTSTDTQPPESPAEQRTSPEDN